MKEVVLLLFTCVSINSYDDASKAPYATNVSDTEVTDNDTRKYYGLSFYDKCKQFDKVFKCLTACKSIGFNIFRLNHACKCTCHEMKTTTILPFFKWRTNGTTRKPPQTYSPRLYHVVGTLSPATYDESYEDEETTPMNGGGSSGPAGNDTNTTPVGPPDSNSTNSTA